MQIDSGFKSGKKTKRERGFTIIQVLITVTLIAVVSTFGVMAIGSARASLRLSGSAREVAGYLEKARSNAIRRNATATLTIVDANTYTVTMDSDGDGTVETRTIRLQDGVTFDPGSLGVSAVFDWRGRVPNQLGILLNSDRGASSSINLSGAGDVTLDDEIFQDGAIGGITLNTNAPRDVAPSPSPTGSPSGTPYPTATPTPTLLPDATPTPVPVYSPTPAPDGTPGPTPQPTVTPTPYPGQSPTPTPAATPVPCSLTAPSTLTFAKNASPATFSVSVANGSSSVVAARASGDITVTPASTTVTGASNILYTVTYPPGNSSGGTITITSPCGNRTITVRIN